MGRRKQQRWASVAVALVLTFLVQSGPVRVLAQSRPGPPPATYELMIDGESFLVEANRVVELQSKEKPGVSYQVAIRLAPVQRLKLDNFQLEFDQNSTIEDGRQRERRSMKLQHQLGFTLLLTDLGDPLDEAQRDKALAMLGESVLKTLRSGAAESAKITSARLPNHQFEGVEGRGIRIRRRDAAGIDHSTLVYILVGKTFTASCLVEFLDQDGGDVLPLVRRTLDSIRPVDVKPGSEAKEPPPK